jgi:hypothetical protein
MKYNLAFDPTYRFAEYAMANDEAPIKVTDVLIMAFLLLLSGNPFFTGHYDMIVAMSIVIPAYYVLTNSYRKINFNTVFIFTFLLGYELMHAWVYSLDYSFTIFKLFLVLLLAFSAVQILGDKFIRVLTLTMCIFAVLSIIFTALCYIPGLKWQLWNTALKLFPFKGEGFKEYATPTLLVYTFHPQFFYGEFDYNRNAGPFWESGAFAVYLNLTLFLNYISRPIRHVRDLFDKKSLLLIFTVLTTTSTMGFLALMCILTFFTMQLKTPLKFIFLLLVGLMGYLSFVSVEFLGDKIATQLEESDERNNRFGAAIMDWKDIKERPLIGSSRRLAVIFGKSKRDNSMRRPNGLTNFLRDYGIIYFSVYFTLVYFSFRRVFHFHNGYYKNSYALFGVILLWLLSFSELIFDLPFFKALIFLAMTYVAQYHDMTAEERLEREMEPA